VILHNHPALVAEGATVRRTYDTPDGLTEFMVAFGGGADMGSVRGGSGPLLMTRTGS
jgi:hypothetical protein